MGSIIISWEGVCAERATQERLVAALRQLAERSQEFLDGPAVEQPAFLKLLNAQRGQSTPTVAPIRFFDEVLTGNIVLDPRLTVDGQKIYDQIMSAKTETIELNAGAGDKVDPTCLLLNGSSDSWCVRLAELRVYGIDFQLYDPRGIYPNEDRVSFVFLESAELPFLKGHVAMVENRAQSQAYSGEAIRAADWYISTPSLHLRYYLENWMDIFLGWVKFFFIPELYYSRYEPLPSYEALKDSFAGLADAVGHEEAASMFAGKIIEMFTEEAVEWQSKVTEMN